jgi:hypothetical protein
LIQNAVEKVRRALEGAIAARTLGPNTILSSFDRSCSIYPIIETLGAATDLEVIRKYAVLPKNSEGAVESLKIEVEALKSSSTQNELKHARDRASVVDELKTVIEIAKAFDLPAYGQRVKAREDEASQRRNEAGSKAFEGLEIPGILTQEWRQFIQAGEVYLKKHLDAAYPADNEPCAFCQQPLLANAVELVRKYRDFSNNAIKEALDTAERQLHEYVGPVTNLEIERIEQRLATVASGEADVLWVVKNTFSKH